MEIDIKQPSPVHHARFMGQAIFYLKLKIRGNICDVQTTFAIKKEVELMSEFVSTTANGFSLQARLHHPLELT